MEVGFFGPLLCNESPTIRVRRRRTETVVAVEDFPGQSVCACVFVFVLNLAERFLTALTAVLSATQVL